MERNTRLPSVIFVLAFVFAVCTATVLWFTIRSAGDEAGIADADQAIPSKRELVVARFHFDEDSAFPQDQSQKDINYPLLEAQIEPEWELLQPLPPTARKPVTVVQPM